MIAYYIGVAVFALVSLVGFHFYNAKSKVLSNKKAILFYLLFSIIISLGGFIGYSAEGATSMLYFLLLQAGYFGLGTLAAWCYRRYAPPPQDGKLDWGGVFFVLINAFVGMIGFTLIYSYFSPTPLAPYYSLSVLPFVLPQALNIAFKSFQAIPQDIHKIWYYPVHADEVDFDKVDTSNIYMLEMEYSKTVNDPRLTNTRLRAPVAMVFGDWFRSFVENYNYKFEADPIDYMNEDGTPQGWMFYVKPSLLGRAKYIDPEKSIADNQIKETHTIIAKRVGLIEEAA